MARNGSSSDAYTLNLKTTIFDLTFKTNSRNEFLEIEIKCKESPRRVYKKKFMKNDRNFSSL